MPFLMSIAFSSSFSPRKRAISSSYFFFSRTAWLSIVSDAFPVLLKPKLNQKFETGKESIKLLSKSKTRLIIMNNSCGTEIYLLVCCFSCNIWTYSHAFDKMPPFDWPSIAAILGRPLFAPISVAVPSAGMILPSFIIQWLILSRRLRSTSLCVARRRSSRFLNELNGSMCEVYNRQTYTDLFGVVNAMHSIQRCEQNQNQLTR